MSIKILLLCLVFVSTFKEFVEFSLNNAEQMLKLQLQAKLSLKQIFGQKTFAPKQPNQTFYMKMPI